MEQPGGGHVSDQGGHDWPLADSTQIRLFYVGHDEAELGGVAAYAASEYEGITLVTDTDVEAAIETVRRWPFDCVVVQSDAPGEEWHDLISETACPVILYTDEETDEIPRSVRESVETVVGRGSGGYRSLFANVVGVARSPPVAETRSGNETVQSLEADSQETTGCFLVDGNGRIHWSNVTLGELFREGSPRDRASTHFYRRLAAIFEGDGETALNLTSMLNEGRGRHGKVLRARVGERMEFFLHSSYPVLDGKEDLRFEIISRISELVESYDRAHLFEELADNAVDGLFALDANGYVDYCNRSYAAMAGYDRDELVGTHAAGILAPGEVERAQRVLVEIMDSERESDTVDLTIETADGDTVDASYHFKPRETTDGEYAGLIGVVRNITERKARERELEEYRTLVESAGDPMYVTDEMGDIVVLNEALVDFTGLPRERLHGMNVAELHPEESFERERQARQHVLDAEGRQWESFDVWLTDSDGDERLFEVTMGAVVEDGSFAGTVATFRDVTERHRKQEKIELLKEVFARSLRHNIRNEASVIEGFATVLADRVDEADRPIVERIRSASRSLAETSEKVSDLDWVVDGEFEVVTHDLSTVVETALDAVDGVVDADCVTVDLPDGVRVRGIRDLDVAFRNLVENALEHGHVDGEPDVTVSVTDRNGDSVTVTVADDGPGIHRQEVRVIERSEETALEHGSGLGLWLVDQVVGQSCGELSFEVCDGTMAHVRLQRADAE